MSPRITIASEPKDLLACVKNAVLNVQHEDPNLFECEAHEQSISHRIAVYLERDVESKGLIVDCEYNKHLDDPKYWGISPKVFNCKCTSCGFRTAKLKSKEKTLFRPDIIVHKRGDDVSNLLAIEVKRNFPCQFDFAKLIALTSPTGRYVWNYKLGVFLYFSGGKAIYKCFIRGKEASL